MNQRVLTIGFQPEVVDFSAFPGMTAEKVYAGLAAQERAMRELGFEPTTCLIDLGETAEEVARTALAAGPFAVVLIGAGVRLHPAHFHLFERIVNVVHAHAPTSKIAFNTSPNDTAEAILRWASAPAPVA